MEVHMLTADQVAEKWARNTTAAAPTYRDAVQSLTVNPLQRAAEKADDWQARVSDSRTKEKFRNGLQRYSFEEWKAKTATVGASRIADGVRQAAPRMRAFLQELLPYTQSLKEGSGRCPSATKPKQTPACRPLWLPCASFDAGADTNYVLHWYEHLRLECARRSRLLPLPAAV
jgi:hypothetical protein